MPLGIKHYTNQNYVTLGRVICHVCLYEYSPLNRPRLIYQHSNMAPRLSGQMSIFIQVSFGKLKDNFVLYLVFTLL